jgi:hypothetical protein
VPQATTIRQTEPKPSVYVYDPSAIPKTGEEVQALRIKLRDLRRELQDAAERRNSVAGRLRSADISARPGYEARLTALDSRILQLENEITRNDMLLNQAPPAALVAGTSQDPDPAEIFSRVSDAVVPLVAIISVFVLMPFAIAISRLIWKRASAIARPPAPDHLTQQRLDQLQQAVDTIAVEVERISEGQRFVTKLVSERSLSAGAAEPIRSAQKSAIPSERG